MSKSLVYIRSFKSYLPLILISILLLPFYGIGIAGFIYIYKNRQKSRLEIADQSLKIIRLKHEDNVEIKELIRAELLQSKWHIWMNTGIIRLTTLTGKKIELFGIENPGILVESINETIGFLQKQQRKKMIQKRLDSERAGVGIGGLEQMNDLVGLWQQGLIDDSMFEEESKKFKK